MHTTEVEWDDNGTMIGFSIVVNTPDDKLWSKHVVAGHIWYKRSPIETFFELSYRRKGFGIKWLPFPMTGCGEGALNPVIESLELVPNPTKPEVVKTLLERLRSLQAC